MVTGSGWGAIDNIYRCLSLSKAIDRFRREKRGPVTLNLKLRFLTQPKRSYRKSIHSFDFFILVMERLLRTLQYQICICSLWKSVDWIQLNVAL